MKKKHKFILLPKVEGFRQNVSVDTLNAALTNSTDFFREKTLNHRTMNEHKQKPLNFWRQSLSIKNLLLTKGKNSFDNPDFFGQKTKDFLPSAQKNFAEVLDRRFNHIGMFFKKTQCSSISYARCMGYSFNNPANGFLSKCKKSPRVRRKMKK